MIQPVGAIAMMKKIDLADPASDELMTKARTPDSYYRYQIGGPQQKTGTSAVLDDRYTTGCCDVDIVMMNASIDVKFGAFVNKMEECEVKLQHYFYRYFFLQVHSDLITIDDSKRESKRMSTTYSKSLRKDDIVY